METKNNKLNPEVITWAVVVVNVLNDKTKRILKKEGFGTVFSKYSFFRHSTDIDKAKESVKALGTSFSFMSFYISDTQFGKIHIQHKINR